MVPMCTVTQLGAMACPFLKWRLPVLCGWTCGNEVMRLTLCAIAVSAHQKKGIWRAIPKDVRTLWVYGRRSTHCRKRWEDLRCWARKTAESQLGMASQRGRGAS
ncbi:hypothetical protein NDU88_002266 [Pleurodeles waltl]|uniref:Secreted protein n=1 Tax=Pleurodeles waltl TaxID=8319 RepID=A0AAV7KRN7_PLEWA|nr:hypothetical protein NDU88_002266 [Pleurodeles waltl]